MRCRLLVLPILLLLGACARNPAGEPLEPIDPGRLTIYHNGNILTMEKGWPTAQAIAIRGELIQAVGSSEEILALTEQGSTVIDLSGRTLMPGFVDAHTHILNDHRTLGISLDEAQSRALKNGITTLGTLYVDPGFLREIQRFAESGFLRVRTGLYLVHTDPCGGVLGDWWREHPPTRTPGEMLRVNGVKIFTDGGSCGKVALSFELEPGWGTGDLWFTQEELDEMVARVHGAGYQAAVHAIGDRAVVQALNAIEAALDGGPNTHRHRMEHVSVIPLDQVTRFGDLGVIPVLNGQFPGCTPFGPPIPEGYREMEWPWRLLRESNPDLHIAWHSDVPFLSENPFVHLLGFVTRIDIAGRAVCPPHEWLRDDTLTVEQALSIMTIQSAYALFRDEEVGSLVPGKYADLIVLANNPLESEPDRLANNRVLLTVVGGRVAYCWPAEADLCPGSTNRTPVPLPDTRPPVFVRWLVALLLAGLPLAAMTIRGRHARWIRPLGGWAGIAAGVIWLAFLLAIDRLDEAWLVVFMLPPFLMALGSAGLAVRFRGGRLAGLGLWTALLGAITLAEAVVVTDWFRNDLGWGLFIWGILSHTIGLFLFGLARLRAGAGLLWRLLPVVVGLLGGPVPFGLSFLLPESSDLPFLMLFGALGAGWLLLGWQVLVSQPESRPAARLGAGR